MFLSRRWRGEGDRPAAAGGRRQAERGSKNVPNPHFQQKSQIHRLIFVLIDCSRRRRTSTSLRSSWGTTLSLRRSCRPSWWGWASSAASPTTWGHRRPPKPRSPWPVRWDGRRVWSRCRASPFLPNMNVSVWFPLRPPAACWPWPRSPRDACWATALATCRNITPPGWRRTADTYVKTPPNDPEPVPARRFF